MTIFTKDSDGTKWVAIKRLGCSEYQIVSQEMKSQLEILAAQRADNSKHLGKRDMFIQGFEEAFQLLKSFMEKI